MLLYKRKLFIIFGRSGTGKSTIVRRFNERNPGLIKTIVTTTTRPMRDGEVDGVNYHFKTKEQFERLIAEDGLVEYVEYSGNYYGTTKDEFDYTRDNIIVLEPNGIANIEKMYKDTFTIFKIEIEASDARILERLLNRNSTVEEIARRFRDDKVRFQNLDYTVRIYNESPLHEVVIYFEDILRNANNFL
jgi:guanylate kinase